MSATTEPLMGIGARPDESAGGPIRAGLALLALFFLGFGGWATLAPLNGAVVAEAVVKVEGNRKTIQHLDGGIVAQLLVKEGSQVAAGATLLVLESTQAQAALDVLRFQYDALRAQEARLVAGRDEASAVAFPADLLERRTGAPYYTALVRVDPTELAASPDIVLQPGMAATVMIPTVARSALAYLTGPLLASFDQSFRQR